MGCRGTGGVGMDPHDPWRVPDRRRHLRRRGSVQLMDRRAGVFLVFAAMCLLLVPVTDDEFRWVPITTAIAYVLLAAASLLDARSRKRSS